jgi:hypothetical protein
LDTPSVDCSGCETTKDARRAIGVCLILVDGETDSKFASAGEINDIDTARNHGGRATERSCRCE